MGIDSNPRIPEAPDAGQATQPGSRAASRTSCGGALAKHTAELSPDRARLDALPAQLNRLPEVRQEKVAALGRAISQGDYQVSAEQTAEAMLSEMRVHSSRATQMSGWQGVNQNVGAFIDQRDVLIGYLFGLIDLSVSRSDNGLALTTSNGTGLVAGGQNFALNPETDVSGVQHIFAQGSDLIGNLTSGKLGTDSAAGPKGPDLLSNLDALAAGLANAIHTAHRGGFDLTGTAGGDLFVLPMVSRQGAAASMAVQITILP